MPLTLSLVTPEKTLLTAAADSVRLPLHDGMAGILPGRAPMVARLGAGVMTVKGLSGLSPEAAAAAGAGGGAAAFFVAGGFVQVSPSKPGDPAGGGTVAVLTDRAVRPADIDRDAVRAELDEVTARVPATPEARALRARDQTRLRAMLASAA